MRVRAGIGCGASLEGKRRHAVYCSSACRLRSKRLIAEMGFELAAWSTRSERFWEGIRTLQHRGTRGAKKRARTRRIAP
jgi:hypothetical protein